MTQSAKVATASSVTTAGTAIGAAWLDWIPEDIGKLAILISLTLSAVLIYNHIQKNRRDKAQDERDKAREKRQEERHQIEMEILRKQAK